MKLADLIHEPALIARAELALKKMDWDFDLDATDSVRMDKGNEALHKIEVMMGALYTAEPILAEAIWVAHCPYAKPGSLPAFVLRKFDLQAS